MMPLLTSTTLLLSCLLADLIATQASLLRACSAACGAPGARPLARTRTRDSRRKATVRGEGSSWMRRTSAYHALHCRGGPCGVGVLTHRALLSSILTSFTRLSRPVPFFFSRSSPLLACLRFDDAEPVLLSSSSSSPSLHLNLSPNTTQTVNTPFHP